MQRSRDIGTLSHKWDMFTESLPSGLREPCGKESRKNVRAGGMENTKKQGPLNQQEQSSYDLTETQAAHTGPALILWLSV